MAAAEFPDRLWLVATRAEEVNLLEFSPVFDGRDVAGLLSCPYRIDRGIDWERLARLKYHPAQIDIVELLSVDGGRAMSPNEMSFELQEHLSNTSYHAKELAKAGIVELIDTAQRRGALEHYYRPVNGSPQ